MDEFLPQGYIFSCSSQLSMKFRLLIKAKMLKIKTFIAFKRSAVVFIMLINGVILTFMNRMNLMLS